MSNNSENEDDPVNESEEEENSSEEEEEEEEDTKSKRKSNGRSNRGSKKPKYQTDSEEEEEDEDDDEPKSKKKGGGGKKSSSGPRAVSTKAFATGSFLILKKDILKGDTNQKPAIWRVDGKALLQKYEPFEEDGNVRHRTTCVYTGWSALDKDTYAPVTVAVKSQNNHTLVVELNWDKLKEIALDSD